MKAVRLFGPDDLRVVDVPVPQIGRGELLLRVKAAMICGTDLRMLKNGAKSVPVTLGHEFAGLVAAVGEGVTAFRPGDAIAVAPNYGCGICDACVSGNTQNCPDLRALGVHDDGGFAEFVRIPAAAVAQGNASPLPPGMGFKEATLAEPFSCVYNSFERSCVKPGDSVIVIGAGPIGLLHAKLYRLAGASPVMINDVNAQRLAMCASQDDAFTAVPSEGVEARVKALTGGRGADIIVTAASVPEVQQLAFKLVATNARVIFFGGLPAGRERVELDTNVIHYRQISVTGTSRQSLSQYRRCLDLIGRGLVDVKGVITKVYSLDEALEAFAASARGEGLKTGFSME